MMKRRTKIILGCLTGLLVLGAAFSFFAWKYVNTPLREECWLYLPKGTTRAALADSLESQLPDSRLAGRVYKIYCAIADEGASIHGAYKFKAGATAKDIAKGLKAHTQTPVNVTFNGIRTLNQLADSMAVRLDLSAEEFLAACDSVLPAAGFSGVEQYPAAFIPDTYEFYWTAAPQTVVKKLLDARNNFWNDERRAQIRAMGLTPVEAATLASIAEEETNNAEERGQVARLYLNRIARNMPLQADPTVKFAVGDFELRRITGNHLKVESPYNTYLHQGLPPGPIRIVEKATLQSVLNAPTHNYIYMCARPDESGLHNFATTLAEHNRNAKLFHKWLDSRGIK